MADRTMTELAQRILSVHGYGRILEVGCGHGRLVQAMLAQGVDAWGIDSREQTLPDCADRAASRFRAGSACQLPWPDQSFDTVVAIHLLEHLESEQVAQALSEFRRVAKRSIFLRVASSSGHDRAWWERCCFAAGLRKHPDYYHVNQYAALQRDHGCYDIPLERVPDEALRRYPQDVLCQERDLHMDMLRESGSRSDAHVYRYHLAAEYIRPGDVVVDAACGLGYGSHVIRSITKAAEVIGIDSSDFAVAYAAENFSGNRPDLSFRAGLLPECLAAVPDSSVDSILSFETLEHVPDPQRLLAEFCRILTPGGRLIASVPNDWRDSSGKDPNPFHLHVYDADKFRDQLAANFAVEWFVAQTADRAKKLDAPLEWEAKPRQIVRLPADDALRTSAEWWIAVAAKSVSAGRRVAYEERVWPDEERFVAGNALAFSRDYENPWLVRGMISIGLRTECGPLLETWAQEAQAASGTDSADCGAALCVRGYRALQQTAGGVSPELSEEIDSYLHRPFGNPNTLRWHVSLNYLMGLAALKSGLNEKAVQYFEKTLELPAIAYSPTLLTKTAEAGWYLGLLHACNGNTAKAKAVWLQIAQRLNREVGEYFHQPQSGVPPFFLQYEVASVVNLAGRLFSAARCSDYIRQSPRIFWNEVHLDHLAQVESFRRWAESCLEAKNWAEQQLQLAREKIRLGEESAAKIARLHSAAQGQADEITSVKGELKLAESGKQVAQANENAATLARLQRALHQQAAKITSLKSQLQLAESETTRLRLVERRTLGARIHRLRAKVKTWVSRISAATAKSQDAA